VGMWTSYPGHSTACAVVLSAATAADSLPPPLTAAAAEFTSHRRLPYIRHIGLSNLILQ